MVNLLGSSFISRWPGRLWFFRRFKSIYFRVAVVGGSFVTQVEGRHINWVGNKYEIPCTVPTLQTTKLENDG